MSILGITGRAGSGKSTAAAVLKQKGAVILDLDAVTARLYDNEEIRKKVVRAFGPDMQTNNKETLDRDRLRSLCFSDPEKLKRLNSIFFPLFVEEIKKFRNSLPDDSLGVVDGAVLFDADLDRLVDRIIWFEAPEPVMIRRFAERKGISAEQAESVLNRQASMCEKRDMADAIIETSSDIESTRAKLLASVRKMGLLCLLAIALCLSGCGCQKAVTPLSDLDVDDALTMYDHARHGRTTEVARRQPSRLVRDASEDIEELTSMEAEERAEALVKRLFPPAPDPHSLVGRRAELAEIDRAARFLNSNRPHDAIRAAEELISHNPRNPEIVMRGQFVRAMAFSKLGDQSQYEEAMSESMEAMSKMAGLPEVIQFRDQRTRMQDNIEDVVPWLENIAPDGVTGDEGDYDDDLEYED